MQAKNIAIIGFGQEGVSAANYFGTQNNILIYDDKEKNEVEKELLEKIKHKPSLYFNENIDRPVDIIIRSPGVRPDHLQITKLQEKGAKLTSTTKIFFEKCPAPIIGITGTKGKGTTASLIYEFLKTQFKQVFLAGNIGTPMLDILPKITPKSLVVLELSSFQLMDLNKSPHIAVVLMITSEHLDWHKNKNEYLSAKFPIVTFQTENDYAIVNADFKISKSFSQKTQARVFEFSTESKTNGVYISNEKIISEIGKTGEIASVQDVALPGRHNLQNVAAAASVAKIMDINNSNIVKVLKSFRGLPHRLQLIREIAGIKYYNDSFSTTPETTIAAIEAFQSPKVLILGGSSKNSDFSKLSDKISSSKSIKAIILIGQESKRIKKAIGEINLPIVEGAANMTQIVGEAKNLAQRGNIVLLSPACASFDMFKNYKDRGDQFIEEIRSLR